MPPVSDRVLSGRLVRARMAVWGMLVLGAGIALWGRYTELASRPQIISEAGEPRSPAAAPAPEVRFLLVHKGELSLTRDQEGRIAKLQAEWEQASAGLRAAGTRASAEAEKHVVGAKVTSAAIQHASAPVVAVSAELSRLRRLYWDTAVGLLSKAQQAKLRPLMRQVTLADLLPVSAQGGVGRKTEGKGKR